MMDFIFDSFYEAVRLILSLDKEVIEISLLSIKVSCEAVFISTMMGVPIGFVIAHRQFPGKRWVTILINTMMALPTVAIGLIVYAFLTRRGPLGSLGLLYTPWAMMIGQTILATPIITGLSISAIQSIDKRVSKEAISLGATPIQSIMAILFESRLTLCGAIMAGFGRVFTEVGASMMLGGNIAGYTRNIPTAIALETRKGEFVLGMALGLILIAVALFINTLFSFLYGRMK